MISPSPGSEKRHTRVDLNCPSFTEPIVRVNAANHDGYVKTSHRFPQYPMLGLNSRLATCLYGYWTVPFLTIFMLPFGYEFSLSWRFSLTKSKQVREQCRIGKRTWHRQQDRLREEQPDPEGQLPEAAAPLDVEGARGHRRHPAPRAHDSRLAQRGGVQNH